MKIERTHDMELVREILSHPSIWPHIHEDGTDEPAPDDHEQFHWMLVSDGAPAGVFLLHPRTSRCLEMHTCLLPRIWGAGASEAARLLANYVFQELGALKLVTNVPASNRRALRFAQASGGKIEGVNRASFMRNGVMEDLIMLGLTYEEWKLCQQQSQS